MRNFVDSTGHAVKSAAKLYPYPLENANCGCVTYDLNTWLIYLHFKIEIALEVDTRKIYSIMKIDSAVVSIPENLHQLTLL